MYYLREIFCHSSTARGNKCAMGAFTNRYVFTLHFCLSLISESTQENARFNATPVELHFLSVRTSTVIIVPFTCKKNVSNATNVTR